MSEGKMKGWLWKQGFKVKNWKHRYFIMHQTYLEYIDAEKEAAALGSIPLGMVVCYVPFKNETDRPFSFALQTPDRTFYLSAETEIDMKRWVDAIKLAIQDIFVNQVNKTLPTTQAYAEPVEKKEDGFRALSRGITKRLLGGKEPKEKERPAMTITNPTSSVSTLSSPSPSPASTIPVAVPSPSPSAPVTISPTNSPPSSPPRAAIVVEDKPKTNNAVPLPYRPVEKPVNRTTPIVFPSRSLPTPPSPSSTPSPSSVSSPPALPERVLKPKGLVRPPRPPAKPTPSLDTPPSTSPPAKPFRLPGPTAKSGLTRTPSSNLGPETKEMTYTSTTNNNETNVTNGSSTTYNIQTVDNLVINNNIVIHCSPTPASPSLFPSDPLPTSPAPPPAADSRTTKRISGGEEEQSQKRVDRMLGSRVPLTAQVVRTVKKNDFTAYQVDFAWGEHTWTCWFEEQYIFRRFKQFDELDGYLSSVLRSEYCLPSKTLKHNFKDKFVEKRREELDKYIQGCSQKVDQIMATRKCRKQWFKFIKPAQLGDLRGVQFSFDIFATPDETVFFD